MPTYEYECDKCGHAFERFQSMKDEPVKTCPECRSRKVRRLFGGGAGIIFKGSGFYETDYKRKESKPESKSDSSGGDSSAKSESKGKSEGKSESKSEAKDKKSSKKDAA